VFRLALRLGKTKQELIRDLGPRELGEWMAYFDLEPPDEHHEQMFGALMAGMYNSSGNSRKAYQAKDFLPKRERLFESVELKRKRAADQIRAIFGKPKK
jgi:hypothetical protein